MFRQKWSITFIDENTLVKNKLQAFAQKGPHQALYRGADKSLARPGRKQSRKHIRDACDFNNIETRAVIKFFPARQGAEGNSRHSDGNIN